MCIDIKLNQKLIRGMLSKLGYTDCTVVDNGQECLDIAVPALPHSSPSRSHIHTHTYADPYPGALDINNVGASSISATGTAGAVASGQSGPSSPESSMREAPSTPTRDS